MTKDVPHCQTKMSLNYSKWDNICVSSDDDEDCHPNIHKDTWRRLRKQQREDNRVKEDARLIELNAILEKKSRRLGNLNKRLAKADTGSSELEKIRDKITLCNNEAEEAKKEIATIEKNRKLTIDDLCLVTEERTIVTGSGDKTETSTTGDADKAHALANERRSSKSDTSEAPPLPQPEFAADAYLLFVEKYKSDLEKFVAMATKDARDNNDFLQMNHHLLHEHTSGWLLLLSLEREMAEPHRDSSGMRKVVRQYLLLQTVLDLAKQMKKHPRDVLPTIMRRIHEGGDAQQKKFNDEVEDFARKIEQRAVAKKKEEAKRLALRPDDAEDGYEYVEMTKEERLGAGGLDPVEVFETLPKPMQKAFESKDIALLQKVVSEMDPDEAEKHMHRCELSGLWCPGE